MRKLTFLSFCLISVAASAQQQINDSTYQTSKGKKVVVGQVLTIGIGTREDGSYNYLYTGGSFAGGANLTNGWNGLKFTVTKISKQGKEPQIKYWLECIPTGRKRPKYMVDVEPALVKEEIVLPD